jgi:HipA-like C-terminal domain
MPSIEPLLAALRKRGVARGKDLAADLQVSQPTLSRLVRGAGERVCRFGRGRATLYVLTRSLPLLGTKLPIHRVDEAGTVHPHGTLHLLANGRHWLERKEGPGQLFDGLPPFAWDMSPQGYLGRSFSACYPELGLPARTTDWHDDHRLIALARRGEDCVGDLILGSESLDRFFAQAPRPVRRAAYPELARTSLLRPAGSSAGGEHPKFTAYLQGGHVLVKFADAEASTAAQRWRDLLVCESIALAAVRAAGIAAVTATWFDIEGSRFLEVPRFDRLGARGRRGVLSLAAIDDEYFGYRDSWTKAAQRLLAEPRLRGDAEDARRLRWLDAFGQLIGNDDRHFGNISFFVEDAGSLSLRLAPVYDMLPMVFAPEGIRVVEREFTPRPATADNYDVWPDAARCALAYWNRLVETAELSSGFRKLCARCRDSVAALRESGG